MFFFLISMHRSGLKCQLRGSRGAGSGNGIGNGLQKLIQGLRKLRAVGYGVEEQTTSLYLTTTEAIITVEYNNLPL